MLPGHVAVVQGLADALVKLVAFQPIQFHCLRVGEYVHAARDHAVDLLPGFAAEVVRRGRSR